jgi:hypothetical protein
MGHRSRCTHPLRCQDLSGTLLPVTARRVANVALVLWIVALVITFVVWLVSIFALDKAKAYGRMDVPGAAVVHLPAGQVDVAYHAYVPGSTDDVNLVIPSIDISAAPANGDGPAASLEESYGATVTINNDAHQRVARMQVPREADYRVKATATTSAIRPELWFGHGGPAGRILAGGLAITLAFVFVWITARQRARG